ncbi:HlyD family efflux transporter periplasmic adaptor subunit [Streptomyces ficellus]|uniref:HlyD family efflux transporter periplasmic adaptor subunit n=1 Tax=Streptomyces ficellus TaxID=1977088 RepID=A0A6I6FF10_9ACTN|nr:HlyD family efflux transporter periplasmic adaptor subunit [Streptomyces ficellus]QGV77665.1 HlyD family efflux transporter periplasmic adaptor subunit [Streptomyces ficellus]
MQFRQKALSKLQSPEEIDLPVRFARPQGLLVLAVTVVAMAAATVWAVTGSVSATLTAPGVLSHGKGSYVLQSPVAGQVTAVLADEGDHLPAGAPLLNVRTSEGTSVVRTIEAGRVTTLVAAIGSVVTTGSDVASVERVGTEDAPLTATLYVPADRGASVPVGASVDLTVPSVPSQTYGVLRGRVKAVGRTAQTRQRITAFLGNSQLGEQFSRAGQPVAVVVELERSPATRTGYAWSTSEGPGYALDSMTVVSASVHLASEHPADWLLP